MCVLGQIKWMDSGGLDLKRLPTQTQKQAQATTTAILLERWPGSERCWAQQNLSSEVPHTRHVCLIEKRQPHRTALHHHVERRDPCDGRVRPQDSLLGGAHRGLLPLPPVPGFAGPWMRACLCLGFLVCVWFDKTYPPPAPSIAVPR
jgi:hypothetical protein